MQNAECKMQNEQRLIDANDYPCNTCDISYCYKNCDKFNAWFEKTVDAVEVVRCKDCKYWNCWRNSGEGSGDCILDEGYATLATQHYDFCSYGERREGE